MDEGKADDLRLDDLWYGLGYKGLFGGVPLSTVTRMT